MTDLDPSLENRKRFIETISELMKEAKFSGEMIFDTPKDHHTLFPHTSHCSPLTISYAPKNLEADDLIVEMLYIKKKRKIIVVTSDRNLCSRIREEGATTLDVDTFVSLLMKKQKGSSPQAKPSYDTQRDIKRLEEIFIKKMKDTNG